MARRKPVSIATEGMYRKFGVVALGLALCAAFLGNDTTQTPAAARARASGASHAVAAPRRHVQVTGLADRDGPAVQDRDAEIGALLMAGAAAPASEPGSDAAAPQPGTASAEGRAKPTPEQARALIEQSYQRSGNEGGGD